MDKGVVWECCGTSQTLIEDVEAYNTTLYLMRLSSILIREGQCLVLHLYDRSSV